MRKTIGKTLMACALVLMAGTADAQNRKVYVIDKDVTYQEIVKGCEGFLTHLGYR